MQITIGSRDLDFPGKYIDTLEDSNDILSDAEALRQRMKEKGYLLLRGVLDRELVMDARRQMMEALAVEGLLDPTFPVIDGVVKDDRKGGFRGGKNPLTEAPSFVKLVRQGKMIEFFEHFLGGEVRTFDYRWLRVVPPGRTTAAHYDVVYMGRGTLNLYTAWTPLGDVPYQEGPLAILDGSHKWDRVIETYGKMDVDRDNFQGSFSTDPVELVDRHGGIWRTTEFKAGDLLLFGMFTMHASLRNESNRFRLSSDTRYQLASDPVDERWVGENPIAHYAWNKAGAATPTAELREKWQV